VVTTKSPTRSCGRRGTDTSSFIIRRILGMLKRGTRIVYVTGNHDEFLRTFAPQAFGHMELVDMCVHVTVDGRMELVDHTWLADQPTLDEPPQADEPIDAGPPLEPAA